MRDIDLCLCQYMHVWITIGDPAGRCVPAVCSVGRPVRSGKAFGSLLLFRNYPIKMTCWDKMGQTVSGWWFGTFRFFHILGTLIPFDFHIFQRGRSTTNQVWKFRTSMRLIWWDILDQIWLDDQSSLQRVEISCTWWLQDRQGPHSQWGNRTTFAELSTLETGGAEVSPLWQ